VNFFIFGHFRKSGEIVFDNLEGVLIENSKEFINLTNLFNGNQFMEKAGNSIINRDVKIPKYVSDTYLKIRIFGMYFGLEVGILVFLVFFSRIHV
jgi:hypothetical protein